MLENFIYAKEKSLFEEKLNNGEVLDEAIVFIEDTKEIWNHGTYFDGSTFDPSNIEESIAKLEKFIGTDVANRLSTLEGASLDKETAQITYQPIGDYATKEDIKSLNNKQDNILDLDTIRSGAALGATALQSIPVAKESVLGGIQPGGDITIDESGIVSVIDNSHNHSISNITDLQTYLDGKQSVITDLENIRSGALLGTSALQAIPSNYITEEELSNTLSNYISINGGEISGDLKVVNLEASNISGVTSITSNQNTELVISTLGFYYKEGDKEINITYNGAGNKFLSDDGSYKAMPSKLSEFTDDVVSGTYLTINNANQTYVPLTALNDYTLVSNFNTLSERVNTIDTKYIDSQKLSTALSPYALTESVNASLSGKVDKVNGKQLSTEDFTTTLKNKLNGLYNYNDSAITNSINTLSANVADAIAMAQYYNGISRVNSVVNIPIIYRLVLATISADSSLSLASVPSVGKEVHVIIHNTATKDIAVTIPNSGNYVNTLDPTLTVKASSYAEVNLISDGSIIYIKYV